MQRVHTKKGIKMTIQQFEEQADAPESMKMVLERAEMQIKEVIKHLAEDENMTPLDVSEAIEAMHTHNMECMHFNQTLMGVRLEKEKKLGA